jgi:hypothetical protein
LWRKGINIFCISFFNVINLSSINEKGVDTRRKKGGFSLILKSLHWNVKEGAAEKKLKREQRE